MSLQSRQGDLLFLRQDMRPVASLVARPGPVIVAGESTGHAHRLRAGPIEDAPDGVLSLEATQTTQVVHEEHAPLTLEPGLWLAVRTPEYSPEAIRRVAG